MVEELLRVVSAQLATKVVHHPTRTWLFRLLLSDHEWLVRDSVGVLVLQPPTARVGTLTADSGLMR